MKRISAIAIATILMTGATFAQTSASFKVKVGKFNEELNEVGKSSVNEKTMNNFSKMFGNATNVIWTSDKDNINRVYFETKGKVTRAGFNRKGQFLYSICTYKEECLPEDVLLMVKKSFYNKSIFAVSEVNALNRTAYLITLEDATSWLRIKVLDGEISEESASLKSN